MRNQANQRVSLQLSRDGIKMVELPQSVPNLTAAGETLYSLIRGHNLLLYQDDDIRQAAAHTSAIESSRG